MLDTHSALIYLMVIIAAADGDMTDAELHAIGENVRTLPVFAQFDVHQLPEVSRACALALNGENGIDQTLVTIGEAVPDHLRETAYALAVEVTVAEHAPGAASMALLETVRERLAISGLSAAAIHHAARARHLA